MCLLKHKEQEAAGGRWTVQYVPSWKCPPRGSGSTSEGLVRSEEPRRGTASPIRAFSLEKEIQISDLGLQCFTRALCSDTQGAGL